MSYGGNAGFWGIGCKDEFEGGHGDRIPAFLTTLSPGIRVELQYDHQPPARGTFQGFERGNVLLTDYDGFPGLVRIAANRINAVAPY